MVKEKGEGERTVGIRPVFNRLNSTDSHVPIVPPAIWQELWYGLLVNAHLDEQVEVLMA